MIIKCAYFIKLMLITVSITILFTAVEIAPDSPLLFLTLAIVLIVIIHSLWRSALHDEITMSRKKLSMRQRGTTQHTNISNRAA